MYFIKPANDSRKLKPKNGTSLTSAQTSLTQDLSESPISKWGRSILQSSPEPKGSSYPSYQVDDELVKNTGIVLGFAYHAINAKEELILSSGVPI